MKIFVICTVRNATEEYLKKLYDFVAQLEDEGNEVYLPPRDTNQEDSETGGYRICSDNLNGIINADIVYVSYNPASTGTHFDLGMAFALGKKIKVFENFSTEQTNGKSFQNMMRYWEKINEKNSK